jgi:hypothetical protein
LLLVVVVALVAMTEVVVAVRVVCLRATLALRLALLTL